MNTEQFRKHGKEMVDYICEYLETIKQRRVTPTVSPGWLKNKIPLEAPVQPEPFDAIMEDVEKIIMPGVRQIYIYIYKSRTDLYIVMNIIFIQFKMV